MTGDAGEIPPKNGDGLGDGGLWLWVNPTLVAFHATSLREPEIS